MPQMAPALWLPLFMTVSCLTLSTMSLLYFTLTTNMTPQTTTTAQIYPITTLW